MSLETGHTCVYTADLLFTCLYSHACVRGTALGEYKQVVMILMNTSCFYSRYKQLDFFFMFLIYQFGIIAFQLLNFASKLIQVIQ